MLAVDASFVVEACLTPDGLDRLEGREAIAPALLWSEAMSVLHELRWRKAISADLADTAFHNLGRAAIGVRRPARLQREAWEVATRLGWAKTYDAEYVALARLHGCALLTIDARLARAAAREVQIMGPADL